MKDTVLNISAALGATLLAFAPVETSAQAPAGPVQYPQLPQSCAGAIEYNSSTGAFSCLTETGYSILWQSPSTGTVQDGTIYLALGIPWTSATIAQVVAVTNSGSFTAAVEVNGTTVSGCGAISVTTTPTTITCSGSVSATGTVELVISNVSGTPELAGVQLSGMRSFP